MNRAVNPELFDARGELNFLRLKFGASGSA